MSDDRHRDQADQARSAAYDYSRFGYGKRGFEWEPTSQNIATLKCHAENYGATAVVSLCEYANTIPGLEAELERLKDDTEGLWDKTTKRFLSLRESGKEIASLRRDNALMREVVDAAVEWEKARQGYRRRAHFDDEPVLLNAVFVATDKLMAAVARYRAEKGKRG